MRSGFGVLGFGIVLLAAAGPVRAERFSAIDGRHLVGLCTGRDKAAAAECIAYINGVSDAASFYQKLRPADGSKGGALPAYLCVPTAVTGVQMRELVVNWAKSHPEIERLQASGVVLRALNSRFRCQEGAENGMEQ